MIFRTSYLNRLLLLSFLFFQSSAISAKSYDVFSKSASDRSEYKLSILSDSVGEPSVLEIASSSENFRFELSSIQMYGKDYIILRNLADKAEILSILNCNEAELNDIFPAALSGLVSMMDSIDVAGDSAVELRVLPREEEKSSSSTWMWALMSLIVGFALGYVVFGYNKKKENTLKIDDTVQPNPSGEAWIDQLSTMLNIPVASSSSAFIQSVKSKFDKLRFEGENLHSELKKMEDLAARDKQYFLNIDKIYSDKMQQYFAQNKFGSDLDPQREILEVLLPMALHFQSYIRIKQTKAMTYDKENYENIVQGGGTLSGMEKYPFETDFVSNSPFVASLIAIMKHYDISELKDVLVLDKRISH